MRGYVPAVAYWGLRDYGTAQWEGGDEACDHRNVTQGKGQRSDRTQLGEQPFKGDCGRCGAKRIDSQLGLEKTPEEYVAKMVEVFREVRRVLRKDGTLWLNLGDSYVGANNTDTGGNANFGSQAGVSKASNSSEAEWKGLPAKNLVGIPWRVAFALQADGWWLRSDIIWIKRNTMPESTRDRPTKAIEYFFLLTKSANYFYDYEAVRKPAAYDGRRDEIMKGLRKAASGYNTVGCEQSFHTNGHERWQKDESGERVRARRNSDWFFESLNGLISDEETGRPLALVVNPKGYAEAHFATYPPDLIKPCIMAGTSAKGCCAKCGAPWERIVEQGSVTAVGGKSHRYFNARLDGRELKESDHSMKAHESKTIGWQPTCECGDLYCSVCCTVVVSNYHEKPITKGRRKENVPVVQDEVFRPDGIEQVVQSGVREPMGCQESQDDNGENDNHQRLHNALPSESSKRQGRRLRDGASSRDGKGDWSLFDEGRSSSSSEPQESRQPIGELGIDDQEGPRPEAETETSEVCAVSSLPENDFPFGLCRTCRNPLEFRPAETVPSTVLDCFAGSGTTGAVALELGRKAILIELNPEYVELIRQRCNVTPGLALA